MTTLVEKAKLHKLGKNFENISAEKIELAFAWLRGEIILNQVITVLDFPKGQSSSAYCFLVKCLKKAFEQGQLSIVNK